METSSNSRRWPDHLLIVLFFLILSLPILDAGFHLDPTRAPVENRLASEFPQWPHSLAGLKPFLAAIEAYFDDHFGCRNCLVMWHNKLNWTLFKTKENHEALVGREGWLYYADGQMVEHFRGILQFSDPELAGWKKLLERRRDWLAQRGIQYIFVIAPDKQSVYPEYLPDWLKNAGGKTKLDQFLDYMRVTHSTVQILDLRPALRTGKKFTSVYQKTDTHWNNLGAFFAYTNLICTLAEHQLPGLKPVSLDQFNHTNLFGPGGDLTHILGISQTESNLVSMDPGHELPAVEIFKPTGVHVKDMCYAKNSQGRGRAIVYHDSFGRYWTRFLGYHFGEVDFFWQYNLNPTVIEQQKPVIVINEMLERFFNLADLKALSDQDALP